MIHDGDYYSIFNKENILSLLDEIEQKIIWMFHQNFILKNLMLSISLGQYPDTPTYIEVLSGKEDCPCEAFQRATEEDLVIRERVAIRTERPSVRESGTNGNHAPIGKAKNDGSSANN